MGAPAARAARADAVALIVPAALLLGAALRFRAYLADRSLWLDEAFLAVNILRRGWVGILRSLDFNQGAAPGFLLAEKTAAAVGRSELSLRMPPFLLGLSALVLIVPVARRTCSRQAVPIACLLTALAPSLVYYSTELKQYSGDVAASLLVIWAALAVRPRPTGRRATAAAMGGVLAILMSQAAVLTAAGVGALLVLVELVERRRLRLAVVAPVAAWAVAALVVVVHSVETTSHVLKSYSGSASFADVAAGAGEGRAHALSLLPTSIGADLGLPSSGLGFHTLTLFIGAIAAVGFLALLRTRAVAALVLAMPIAVVFVTSAFGQYPLSGRTTLFLVPSAALLVAEGVPACSSVLPRAFGLLLGAALVAVALVYPVRTDARTLVHPTHREEVRPLLDRLAAQKRPGDRLFVVYSAQYAVAYYADCGCVRLPSWPLHTRLGGSDQWAPALEVRPGVAVQRYRDDDEEAYLRAIRGLPGGRTWVVLSHVGSSVEHAFLYGRLLDAFGQRGTRLATIRAPGALAVLYNLD
jgi:hypothetical protein